MRFSKEFLSGTVTGTPESPNTRRIGNAQCNHKKQEQEVQTHNFSKAEQVQDNQQVCQPDRRDHDNGTKVSTESHDSRKQIHRRDKKDHHDGPDVSTESHDDRKQIYKREKHWKDP